MNKRMMELKISVDVCIGDIMDKINNNKKLASNMKNQTEYLLDISTALLNNNNESLIINSTKYFTLNFNI